MTHSEFTQFVSEQLGELVREKGATLYSSFNTIKEGKLYIMGLNPGGSDDMTIEKSLDEIGKEDYNNQYTIPWDREAGQHPLQKNIAQIVKLFDLHVEDVCATNLIFVRSIGQNGAGYEFRQKYWPIHEYILKTVKPKIIIAFGNGPRSPYQHLKDLAIDRIDGESIDAGHGKYRCHSFSGEIENLSVTVIGLPHLSRYHLYTDNPDKKKVLDWIKSKE